MFAQFGRFFSAKPDRHASDRDAADGHPSAPACKEQGNRHFANGDLAAAAACYRRAIAADPGYAEAWNNLGSALLQQDADEAMACFEKAIALDPQLAQSHFNLGIILQGRGKVAEAAEAFERALASQPAFAAARFNLGTVREAQGRLDEAALCFERVLEVDPAHADALNGLGCIRKEQMRFDDARACFEAALAAEPRHVHAMLNLGNVLRERLLPVAAEDCYARVLAVAPDHVGALQNLGMCLEDQGRLADAEAALGRALALEPESRPARFYLGLAQLAQGKLTEGWGNYDSRFYAGSAVLDRAFPFPPWSGEAIEGKSLLIWEDQGIGDELLFASQFGELVARADRCTIECSPKLVPLLARSFPQALVVARTDPPHPAVREPFDFQCAAGSLARWLRPTLESFPRHGGYLVPPPARVAHWKDRLAALGPGLKVGFCWRSGVRTGSRHLHYTALEQWGPIFAVPGVHFVNLQYDRCDEELDAARRAFGVPLHAFPEIDLFNDLDEAAALTGALDLVITAPTSAGRLAAAQGIETWEMVYGVNWVALGTDHLPWLPAETLHVRRWDQPWEEVIAGVAERLRERARP